jgi:hypothetical protein
MTATVLSEVSIPGLPSASGVEIIGPTAYVISDDSPYVYLLEAATLVEMARVQLFETREFEAGRIPKASKPDLEALVALTWPDGRAGVLALGSGSTPARERGWFVPVSGESPREVPLARLYALLRRHLPAGVVLNLEAAATTPTELLLFQRTVGRADAALVFRLPLAATLRFIAGSGAVPTIAPQSFPLPLLGGFPAGFSGATFVDGQLLISASVESTLDAVLDGEVLGSFIGLIDLQGRPPRLAQLHWPDGRVYQGKVEGLAMRRALSATRWELLLVTDDDSGGSTAVKAELMF